MDAGAPSRERSAEPFLAAVDLGSNSFHMTVARVEGGQPWVVDRLRDRVALGEGLGADRILSEEACGRGLACLERFGQRLREIPADRIRAVGTWTLRRARNSVDFLRRGSQALGHAIEIVSGAEEARLIYLGVTRALPALSGRRLVVDIGGGSTECILGKGHEALTVDSLSMGCIGFSQRFFPRARVGPDSWQAALLAAQLELEPIGRYYRRRGWDECVGSSGSVLAVQGILEQSGWTQGGITPKGLRKLTKAILAAGGTRSIDLPGLAHDRRAVLPGGLAILQAVFDAFEIARMHGSQGALRDGVLYDLLGRIQREDVRDDTIRAFQERYQVDRRQADRVAASAASLALQVAEAWQLSPADVQMLGWAGALHEIGLAIAHSGHHKHGAYIVANAHMPGFSRNDQELLATLIRTHRRKVTRALLRETRALDEERVARLVALLRVAGRLNRARSEEPPPAIAAKARPGRLRLRFPADWLEDHPLTRADLADEAGMLERVGIELRVTAGD